MSHAHHNHESHHHNHSSPKAYDKAFFISILANGLFVVLQIIYAYIANSTSLLADAFHNLGDVLSLVLSWIAMGLMKKKTNSTRHVWLKKNLDFSCLDEWNLTRFYLRYHCN